MTTGQLIRPAPIVKRVEVNAPVERTFAVFTDGIAAWWPKRMSILKSPQKAMVIEPREGGRWYEVGEDGSECDTGRVRVYDEPRRLVLVWQLTSQWAYDPDFETEVEIRFTPDGEGRTIVELEHRDLERFGEAAAQQRESMDGGWGMILDEFVKAAEG